MRAGADKKIEDVSCRTARAIEVHGLRLPPRSVAALRARRRKKPRYAIASSVVSYDNAR
jgi:hypothetical protein